MSADFLLELLSEEIPARMQAKARNDLARMFAEAMTAAGLTTGAIDVHSTPRRLVLVARDVAGETDASREEIKGPRSSAPQQALDGFLRKTGLTRDQLEERDGVYFAVIERTGRAAGDVIADAVRQIIADFPWPKSMRWGSGDMRWVRPLQGIVAMLGEEIVPIEIEGVKSGATTVGHRFHHPGPITIGGADDYFEKLRACRVIVDQDERERIIRDGSARAAADAGLSLIEDEGLVVENAGLTEWPVPLLGRFDPEFLDVPREVIVLTMRTNQKYFACSGDDGGLAPAFVCVANIDASDGGASIVEGNKRVLAARLADARFFWEQDLKVPLEEQGKKLSGIVFHEKLGTVGDKVERVAKLAHWLVEEGVVKGASANEVERAARLAKADLVTGMVGEFPELQGVIGGYLAQRQGEPKAIADAVRDHYKPVGQGDEVPTAPVTVAVSLADKLDTIVDFFAIDEKPTGSKDPYALRRAALGIFAICQSLCLRFRLLEAIQRSAQLFVDQANNRFRPYDTALIKQTDIADYSDIVGYSGSPWGVVTLTYIDRFDKQAHIGMSPEGSHHYWVLHVVRSFIGSEFAQLLDFFADRLKVQQREAGVRHDLIDAVFALGGEDDLVRLLARVKALQAFVETDEGRDLHAGYKRAANILKKEKWDAAAASDADVAAEEAALTSALDAAEPKASAAIEAEDFTAGMAALASLRAPIDAFFDKVTVNADDKGVRARRLNLLQRFRDAVNRVADFSRIEG